MLAAVGVILLITAFPVKERKLRWVKSSPSVNRRKPSYQAFIDVMAWCVFMILLGGYMFVPEEIIKGGWWSIGA